jgi:hypothetical protein
MRLDPYFSKRTADPDEPIVSKALENLGDKKAPPFKKAADGYQVTETVPDSGFRPLGADAPVQIGGVTVDHKAAARPPGPRIIDIDGDQDDLAKETTYAPDGVHIPGAEPGADSHAPLFAPAQGQPMTKAVSDEARAALDAAAKKGWSPQGPGIAGAGETMVHPDLPGHKLHVAPSGKWSHMGPGGSDGGSKLHNAGDADELKDHLKNIHQGFAK